MDSRGDSLSVGVVQQGACRGHADEFFELVKRLDSTTCVPVPHSRAVSCTSTSGCRRLLTIAGGVLVGGRDAALRLVGSALAQPALRALSALRLRRAVAELGSTEETESLYSRRASSYACVRTL